MSQPIKAPLLQAVILMFLITSCRLSQNPATLASAEGFVAALVKRLESKGTVKNCPQGSERTGNIHSKEFMYLIGAAILSPDDVYSLATHAATDWGQTAGFASVGGGGGRNHFQIHYGTDRSHAFIDVIAYPERDQTRVDVFLRVIE